MSELEKLTAMAAESESFWVLRPADTGAGFAAATGAFGDVAAGLTAFLGACAKTWVVTTITPNTIAKTVFSNLRILLKTVSNLILED